MKNGLIAVLAVSLMGAILLPRPTVVVSTLQAVSQTAEGERQLLLIMHDTCNAVLQRLYFDGVLTHEQEFEAKQLLCYGYEADSLNAKRLDSIKKRVYP